MRNAGDRTPGGPGGRRHRAPSGEDPPPVTSAGGASLFTPAYRVSHAAGTRAAGQDRPDSAALSPAGLAYGHGADLAGSGYQWADQPSGHAAGGYPGGYRQGDGGPAWPDDDLTAGYRWAADDEYADAWPGASLRGQGTIAPRSNAVRGFPPGPDEPLPVYPPGPFAAWNRQPPGAGGPGSHSTGDRPEAAGQLATATITPDEFDTDYSLPAITDPILGQEGKATAAAGTARGAGGPSAGTAPGRTARRGAGPADTARRGAGPADDPRLVAGHGTGSAPGTRGRRAAAAPDAGRGGKGKGRTARPRRKRQSAWMAIAAAVVIIAAVAVILAITSPGGGTPSAQTTPSHKPQPGTTSPTPPPGQWGFIGSRKTDPQPLTLPELYPATFTSAGVVYTKAKGVKGTNCHAALIGADLQAAVRLGGCSQALRATYVSKSAKQMATIGVFNLKTAALAGKAALKAGRSEFVAQLAAKAGPAKAIGQGTGIEEAIVKGHYLILVWAESTDLTAPVKGKAARTRYETFMHLLISRTVNASLSSRMVDGKPGRSA